MKRNILYISMLLAGTIVWTSCDHEPDFPGLDVDSALTNVAKYSDTYVGATFSVDKPAKDVIPAWLLKKYYTCDKGSSAMVTYKYIPSIPEYVTALSATTPYTVTAADYKTVWVDMPFNYFSPSKKANQFMPGILKEAIGQPVANQVVAAHYNQADEDGSFEGVIAFNDDLESNTLEKWENVTVTGTYKWQIKTFNNNHYLQQSAFNHKNTPLESYLITAEPIDISQGLKLTLDAIYVNHVATGGRVSVLLSSNLAGFTAEAIRAATWDDVTGNFTIGTSTTNAGDAAPVGELSLNKYAGKKIYLAFKYVGDHTNGNVATSTIRIDNIAIQGGTMNIAPSYQAASLYKYNEESDAWAPYAEVGILQPADYVAMGVDNLSASNAQFYVPAYLGLKYPYAVSGTVKAVVFKTPDGYMAAEFAKSLTGWISTSTVTEMTDEYQYSGVKWEYVRTVPKAALNETFDARTITNFDPTTLEGWICTALADKPWYDKTYNKNNYTESAAFDSKLPTCVVDSWLVTPALEIKSNYMFSFDMVSGYWTHDALQVYISDSFSGKKEDIKAETGDTWKEITKEFDLPKVVGKYGTFTNVGAYKLNDYVGKKVYIAFRYTGDKSKGLTSTVQLDNIYVGE